MVQRDCRRAESGCSPGLRFAEGGCVQVECSDAGHSRPARHRGYSSCWAPQRRGCWPQAPGPRRQHPAASLAWGHGGPWPLSGRVRQTGWRGSGVVAGEPRGGTEAALQSGTACARRLSGRVQRREGQRLRLGRVQSLPLPVERWCWSLPECSGRVKPANTKARWLSESLNARAWWRGLLRGHGTMNEARTDAAPECGESDAVAPAASAGAASCGGGGGGVQVTLGATASPAWSKQSPSALRSSLLLRSSPVCSSA